MNVADEPGISTSASLLERIRRHEPEAWRRLAALHTPLVYAWARRSGLQESDAADVVQEVFQTVFTKIGDFQNQGQHSSFRAWLWAIARNRIRLHYRRQAGRAQAEGGTSAANQLQQLPAMLESDSEPADNFSQRALLHRALRLIQGDFTEPTWNAFWQQAVEGRSAAEVAAELETTPTAVRQAKYRVLCRLRDELAGL